MGLYICIFVILFIFFSLAFILNFSRKNQEKISIEAFKRNGWQYIESEKKWIKGNMIVKVFEWSGGSQYISNAKAFEHLWEAVLEAERNGG